MDILVAIEIIIAATIVAFGLYSVEQAIKGIPGWKEYKEPEEEKDKLTNAGELSHHLPKGRS